MRAAHPQDHEGLFEIRRLPREDNIEIGCRRVELLPLERNVRMPEPVFDAVGIKINRPRRRNVGVDERPGVLEKMGHERIPIAEPIIECDRNANIGQRFDRTTESHVRERAVVARYRTLRKLPDCEPIIPKRLDQIVPLGRKIALIHPINPRHIDESSIANTSEYGQQQPRVKGVRDEKADGQHPVRPTESMVRREQTRSALP